MKSLLCDWVFACALTLTAAPDIGDLHYGTLLYAYYQGDHESALVLSLQAEKRGWQQQDPVRYLLAEGSFAFQYGMYQFATERFALVDARALTELDQARLSFHLAREYFRRGDWTATSAQLAALPADTGLWRRRVLHPEILFMQAELATRDGDFGRSRRLLAQLGGHPLAAYGRFNLGSALYQQGDVREAWRTYEPLAMAPASTAELLDLRQRARLAMATLAMSGAFGAEGADAGQMLELLPGRGRYQDPALASYGSLAMQAGNYQQAAQVWQHLAAQPHWNQSTALARLALPLSLEHLQHGPQALLLYQQAEQAYLARLQRLDALAARIDDQVLVRDLLGSLSWATLGADAAEMRHTTPLRRWQHEFEHPDFLQWLASAELHQLVVQWQELHQHSRWLENIPQALAGFEEIAQEQRRRARTAAETLEAGAYPARRAELARQLAAVQARRQALAAQAPAPTLAWMSAQADAEQARLLARLTRMRTQAELGLQGPELVRALARIDRFQGLLFWELLEQQPVLMQQLRRDEQALAATLADIDGHLTRIRVAETEFAAGVGADFHALQLQADGLQARVAQAINARELAIAQGLRRHMARERAEIAQHLVAARLGRARLADALAQTEYQPSSRELP